MTSTIYLRVFHEITDNNLSERKREEWNTTRILGCPRKLVKGRYNTPFTVGTSWHIQVFFFVASLVHVLLHLSFVGKEPQQG